MSISYERIWKNIKRYSRKYSKVIFLEKVKSKYELIYRNTLEKYLYFHIIIWKNFFYLKHTIIINLSK